MKRLTIPSLILSRVVAQPPILITGLLLIEIAQTYGISISTAGQLQTASSLILVLGGLMMSFLAIRFNHKLLMLVGLAVYSISFLGDYLATSFLMLLCTYSLYGLAKGMVDPMASSIVGIILPSEKRSGIIGWFYAGMALCVLVGSPLINVILGFGGWRATFLFFALPFSISALILSYLTVPTVNIVSSDITLKSLRSDFGRILGNRSAFACILGSFLSAGTWGSMNLFSFAFLRQQYTLSSADVSPLLIGTSIFIIFGSLSGGRLVGIFGRKLLSVASNLVLGILVFTFMNSGVYILSVIIMFFACFFSSMRFTVVESLTLEQVPELRGSVMSMNSVANGLGLAVGAGLGGYLLSNLSYSGLGFTGLLALSAGILYFAFARESAG
jgi:DHA1 family putative efflux transporter-like MFS transporter